MKTSIVPPHLPLTPPAICPEQPDGQHPAAEAVRPLHQVWVRRGGVARRESRFGAFRSTPGMTEWLALGARSNDTHATESTPTT